MIAVQHPKPGSIPLISIKDCRPGGECAPAPIMSVCLRLPGRKSFTVITAFLDTGADITCLSPCGFYWLENTLGFTAQHPFQDAYGQVTGWSIALEVSFDFGRTWYKPATKYNPLGVVVPPEWHWPITTGDLLIGRDILCYFTFFCDGPNASFSLEEP